MIQIICPLTLIPLRSEPDHRSEQVSQMLYGETANVIEEKQNWYKIVMDFDSYTGWLEKDSVDILYAGEKNQKKMMVREPLLQLRYKNENFIICAGSEIPLPDANRAIVINDKSYQSDKSDYSEKNSILSDALKFVNTPYLWGGRTVFGMDCSGYIQIVFKINNINLPRDAKDQANMGIGLESFSKILPGDLVFFENENVNITHVGLYLGDNKIIHASKWVRIDTIDEKGIYRKELKMYTHKLKFIRRIE